MSDRVRVLQVIGSPKAGGAETFFWRLMNAFTDLDYGVDVLPVVREGSWLHSRMLELQLEHRTAPFGNTIFDRKTKKVLQECMDGWRPDVIQTWMNRASKAIPASDIPTVARLGGYYNLKYYQKMDHLIGNTEDICTYLKAHQWPAERVHYLPNFTEMPPEGFKDARYNVRDSYGIPHNRFVLLLAGRVHENKGYDVALYALRFLPKNIHILVVGDGPQRQNLKAAVEADGLSDRVTFIDWVPHITPVAAAADVWLVPSRIEPLGNTVLDAWAHEVPVIASKVAGPEALIEDGQTGLLVPSEDEEALVTAIKKVHKNADLRKTLAANGAERFKQHYRKDIVLSQYRKFYLDLQRGNLTNQKDPK